MISAWAVVFVLLFSAAVTFADGVARHDKAVWTSRRGVASYMGAELQGKKMANGKPYNRHSLTCASWHYPLGTVLWVGHDGRHIAVEVTDRGPASRLNREIDLSEVAFATLAPLDLGLIDVTVTPIMPPL